MHANFQPFLPKNKENMNFLIDGPRRGPLVGNGTFSNGPRGGPLVGKGLNKVNQAITKAISTIT